MLTTEQAIDMLPHVLDIIERLDLQVKGAQLLAEARQRRPEASVDDLQYEVGMGLIMHVGRNLPKVKREFFAVVAVASGMSADEAGALPLARALATLRQVFLDPELMGFFRPAVR